MFRRARIDARCKISGSIYRPSCEGINNPPRILRTFFVILPAEHAAISIKAVWLSAGEQGGAISSGVRASVHIP